MGRRQSSPDNEEEEVHHRNPEEEEGHSEEATDDVLVDAGKPEIELASATGSNHRGKGGKTVTGGVISSNNRKKEVTTTKKKKQSAAVPNDENPADEAKVDIEAPVNKRARLETRESTDTAASGANEVVGDDNNDSTPVPKTATPRRKAASSSSKAKKQDDEEDAEASEAEDYGSAASSEEEAGSEDESDYENKMNKKRKRPLNPAFSAKGKRIGRPPGSSKANPAYTPKKRVTSASSMASDDSEAGGDEEATAVRTPKAKKQPKTPKSSASKANNTNKELDTERKKYEKRVHPFDNSLLFNRVKYQRWKSTWADITAAFPTVTPPEIIIDTKTLQSCIGENSLKMEPLYTFCIRNAISFDSFESINVVDVDQAASTNVIAPFTGKVFWNHFEKTWQAPNDLLEGMDIGLNTSAPISWILFPLNSTQTPVASPFPVHIVVGTTRVGWPMKSNDYELSKQNQFAQVELNSTMAVALNTFTTFNSKFGVGTDFVRYPGSKESHHNLLQVWEVNLKPGVTIHDKFNASKQDSYDVKLSYFVALEGRGSAKSAAWSSLKLDEAQWLGVMAVVTGSGECVVLALPTNPPTTRSPTSLHSHHLGAQAAHFQYLNLPVIAETSLRICSIKHSHFHITSVTWSIENPYQLLCGMSDGSVAIYSIKSCLAKRINKAQQLGRLLDSEIDVRVPSNSASVSVSVSNVNPKLVACSHFDGTILIWSLDEPECPIYTKKLVSGCVNSIKWDVSGLGLYISDSESSVLFWEHLITTDISVKRSSLYSHENKYGAVWSFANVIYDEQSFVLTVGSDGNVRGGFTSLLGLIKESGESLMNIFKVEALVTSPAQDVPSTSSSSRSTPHTVVTPLSTLRVSRKVLGMESIGPTVDMWSLDHTVYLRSVDMKVSPVDPEQMFVAYGGDSGVVRMHGFNPKRTLLARPIDE